MATAVIMPKQGNSVESSIITQWRVQVGDRVRAGDVLCDIETDKALMEVSSPADGVVLALFYNAGDDVAVMMPIAAIGQTGEAYEHLRVDDAAQPMRATAPTAAQPSAATREQQSGTRSDFTRAVGQTALISPRAAKLAGRHGLNINLIRGSGPDGRIIERDVQTALDRQPPLTPMALTTVGTGIGGRIGAEDVHSINPTPEPAYEAIPLRGMRKVIADRMRSSLQTTAQLTLNRSADARALLAFRARLKSSVEDLGLQDISINDLLLFAVSRVLIQHPALNATLQDHTIYQYHPVHLGFAVDTPRGLIVPVIRNADGMSLRQIAQAAARLIAACQNGTIAPDDLNGGTFTVSNLGGLGIESFTPVINPPQVAILGVGTIAPKPVTVNTEIQFIPHLQLSLTTDHQVVDGAPAARFLAALADALAQIELLIAV